MLLHIIRFNVMRDGIYTVSTRDSNPLLVVRHPLMGRFNGMEVFTISHQDRHRCRPSRLIRSRLNRLKP